MRLQPNGCLFLSKWGVTISCLWDGCTVNISALPVKMKKAWY